MFSFMITSVGGYHADPGQILDWQAVDQEFSQFALVSGRAAYELMAAFWPTRAVEEPGPGPHSGAEQVLQRA
jgi:hypothetical protein